MGTLGLSDVRSRQSYWNELSPAERVMINDLKTAMDEHLQLPVIYDGISRIVEIHAIGLTKTGKPCIRAWQVSGGSESGETTGWKLMTLAKFDSYVPSNAAISFDMPRVNEGYVKGDKGMIHIFKEL